MSNPVELLEQVVTDLDAVLSGDVIEGLSDEAKMALLQVAGQVQRRVEAVVVETVASVPARAAGSGDPAFCGLFGCRTVNELLQRVLRVDAPGAGRVVKAARAVRREVDVSSGAWLPARWPGLREALLEGVIGVSGLLAAIGPIEQAGARVGTGDRLRADAELAAYARGCMGDGEVGPAATPEDLRLLSRVIVQYLDPDGAEPADDIAMRGRALTLGRAKDGTIPIHGRLLPEVAGQLQRLFDAYLNPKVDGPLHPAGVHFTPTRDPEHPASADGSDEHHGDGEAGMAGMGEGVLPSDDPTRMVDTRTRAQRQHDTLAAVLGIAARHDDTPRLGGAAPTLVVSITANDYATGTGWAHIDGIDTPTHPRTAAHTACAGGIQRVLFDPNGRIIGITTTDRIFTAPQRRAITLRDRECLIPGCHVPATWCEIHHVTEHSHGGPTHTDNGVALCWHHHRTLPTSGWDIRMHQGTPPHPRPRLVGPHPTMAHPTPQPTSQRPAFHPTQSRENPGLRPAPRCPPGRLGSCLASITSNSGSPTSTRRATNGGGSSPGWASRSTANGPAASPGPRAAHTSPSPPRRTCPTPRTTAAAPASTTSPSTAARATPWTRS